MSFSPGVLVLRGPVNRISAEGAWDSRGPGRVRLLLRGPTVAAGVLSSCLPGTEMIRSFPTWAPAPPSTIQPEGGSEGAA